MHPDGMESIISAPLELQDALSSPLQEQEGIESVIRSRREAPEGIESVIALPAQEQGDTGQVADLRAPSEDGKYDAKGFDANGLSRYGDKYDSNGFDANGVMAQEDDEEWHSDRGNPGSDTLWVPDNFTNIPRALRKCGNSQKVNSTVILYGTLGRELTFENFYRCCGVMLRYVEWPAPGPDGLIDPPITQFGIYDMRDTRTHTHTYTYTHKHKHTHTHTNTHTHTHTRTHTHTHTHTHIHTHTHAHGALCVMHPMAILSVFATPTQKRT